MFWWLMAQRRARGPEVIRSEAMLAAGVIVLVTVGGTVGGLVVGCAMVTYGIASGLTRRPVPPPVTAARPTGRSQAGMTERRTRERITVERRWPLAG